jgi:hypothetical protein
VVNIVVLELSLPEDIFAKKKKRNQKISEKSKNLFIDPRLEELFK